MCTLRDLRAHRLPVKTSVNYKGFKKVYWNITVKGYKLKEVKSQNVFNWQFCLTDFFPEQTDEVLVQQLRSSVINTGCP